MKQFRLSYIICLKQYACLKEQLNQLNDQEQRMLWTIFHYEKKGIKIGTTKVIGYNGSLIHLRREALKTYHISWYEANEITPCG